MSYSCLVIDDEPLARKVIEKHLQEHPAFRLEASCENAVSAFGLLAQKKIDLIFLDIQMPGVNGLQFLRSLKAPPAVIFTTAYSEHAAESYELDAVDYLVKPITAQRFARSIDKFLKQAAPEKKEEDKDFLFVKSGGQLVKLLYRDILYVESRRDYLMIYTSEKTVMTHMTMKAMAELLPEDFKRVHRSYMVAVEKVTGIGAGALDIGKTKIPIGENYRKAVGAHFRLR